MISVILPVNRQFGSPNQCTLYRVIVGISTDGSVRTNDDVFGSTYQGTFTTLDTVVSGAGSLRVVHSTDTQTPLRATVIDGPLAGMTTTYKVFGILYEPLSAASPSPTNTTTATPSVPEFSPLAILPVLIIVASLVTAVAIKKKNTLRVVTH